jgi:hypothetical protein
LDAGREPVFDAALPVYDGSIFEFDGGRRL